MENKFAKKLASAALVGVLAAGSLSACSNIGPADGSANPREDGRSVNRDTTNEQGNFGKSSCNASNNCNANSCKGAHKAKNNCK